MDSVGNAGTDNQFAALFFQLSQGAVKLPAGWWIQGQIKAIHSNKTVKGLMAVFFYGFPSFLFRGGKATPDAG